VTAIDYFQTENYKFNYNMCFNLKTDSCDNDDCESITLLYIGRKDYYPHTKSSDSSFISISLNGDYLCLNDEDCMKLNDESVTGNSSYDLVGNRDICFIYSYDDRTKNLSFEAFEKVASNSGEKPTTTTTTTTSAPPDDDGSRRILSPLITQPIISFTPNNPASVEDFVFLNAIYKTGLSSPWADGNSHYGVQRDAFYVGGNPMLVSADARFTHVFSGDVYAISLNNNVFVSGSFNNQTKTLHDASNKYVLTRKALRQAFPSLVKKLELKYALSTGVVKVDMDKEKGVETKLSADNWKINDERSSNGDVIESSNYGLRFDRNEKGVLCWFGESVCVFLQKYLPI
jgi:hypothetical protein